MAIGRIIRLMSEDDHYVCKTVWGVVVRPAPPHVTLLEAPLVLTRTDSMPTLNGYKKEQRQVERYASANHAPSMGGSSVTYRLDVQTSASHLEEDVCGGVNV